jgi:hypothetical protein
MKDFENMTSAELEQHLQELKDAKERQEVKELARIITEETDGRFEIEISFHGVWLHNPEIDFMLFVGSHKSWENLKAFAVAMNTPSDKELNTLQDSECIF